MCFLFIFFFFHFPSYFNVYLLSLISLLISLLFLFFFLLFFPCFPIPRLHLAFTQIALTPDTFPQPISISYPPSRSTHCLISINDILLASARFTFLTCLRNIFCKSTMSSYFASAHSLPYMVLVTPYFLQNFIPFIFIFCLYYIYSILSLSFLFAMMLCLTQKNHRDLTLFSLFTALVLMFICFYFLLVFIDT